MIKCRKCDAPMARSVLQCPKCNYPVPKNIGHCRVCNQELAVSRHRYIDYASYVSVVDGMGGSRSKAFIQHMPCPECGETQPLRKFVDTPLGHILGVLSYIGSILLLLAMILASQINKASDAPLSIILLIGVGSLVMLGYALTYMMRTNKYAGGVGGGSVKRLLWIVLAGSALVAGLIAAVMPPTRSSQSAAPVSGASAKAKHKHRLKWHVKQQNDTVDQG